MAFCTECGHQLAEGAKFCFECGAKVNAPSSPRAEQRKTVYDGAIHKCPKCGETLNSFVINCPTCGYELRSVKTNSPVEALAKKVEMASSLDDKIELITNFYIPNTKEDIYDFFILAVSNLEDNWYDTDDAWRAKLEQAYHKAKLSFGKTAEFEYLEKLYNRTRKAISKRERGISALFRRNKTVFIGSLMALFGITMLAIGIIMMINEVEAGYFLLMMSIACFCFIPSVSEFTKDDKKSKKKRTIQKNNSSSCSIGKDYEDFYNENYDDMAEYLKSRGFRNVVTKPERKGLLDTEGAIKGISVAGNTEFSEDDVFDKDAKIIIRYYSRKC